MADPVGKLQEFAPARAFFLGIDSDGCAFDSMEIKHKECFVPMFIKHCKLQAVTGQPNRSWADYTSAHTQFPGTYGAKE